MIEAYLYDRYLRSHVEKLTNVNSEIEDEIADQIQYEEEVPIVEKPRSTLFNILEIVILGLALFIHYRCNDTINVEIIAPILFPFFYIVYNIYKKQECFLDIFKFTSKKDIGSSESITTEVIKSPPPEPVPAAPAAPEPVPAAPAAPVPVPEPPTVPAAPVPVPEPVPEPPTAPEVPAAPAAPTAPEVPAAPAAPEVQQHPQHPQHQKYQKYPQHPQHPQHPQQEHKL